MAADDFYSVLGVPRSADAPTIKKAYRKLAKDLHPDKNPGNAVAETKFKAVNRAFDTLSNDKKRALYDEFGEEGLREGFDADKVRAYKRWSSAQGPGGAPGGGGGFRSSGGNPFGGGGQVNLEDLFGGQAGGNSEIFGDLFGRGRRQRGPQKGQDLESRVSIDFVSAIKGASLELRPTGSAAASGGDPLTVRIPPGASDGSRVRIAGQGAPSSSGGPPGDLLLDITVEPHPFFKREGDDLHLDVPLTVNEAYRGAKVKVPTPDGEITLKVAPHTQSGGVARVRGKGVTRKGKPPGDLYVHYLVRVPLAESPELDALLEKVATFQPEDPRAALRF
jgi:curved DNA-binding protein